jgi:nucleoside-diphosphate-sugar epimerase
MGYELAYRGKTVLVTGGAGAIGSNLCRRLALLGARVLVLDNLAEGVRWNIPDLPNVKFIEGDILDDAQLISVFRDRPKIVFHLAAFFANQNSVDNPERDLQDNGVGTLKVLQYSRLCSVDRVVYASSSSIYQTETSIFNLTTPYQITKFLGELYCDYFYKYLQLETVRTRLFNSYGPGEVPGKYRNVIPNFIYWALQGKPLPITGTGKETRDFTYVEDVVDGILRAGVIQEAVGREISLGSGKETKIADLAAMINRETGNSAGVKFSVRRSWDGVSRRCAPVQPAFDLLGFEARTPIEVGLRTTIRWFRDNWHGIEASARFGTRVSSPDVSVRTAGMT